MVTMTTIRILVIEDMVETISGAFELAALSEFNENMKFDFKRTSQHQRLRISVCRHRTG